MPAILTAETLGSISQHYAELELTIELRLARNTDIPFYESTSQRREFLSEKDFLEKLYGESQQLFQVARSHTMASVTNKVHFMLQIVRLDLEIKDDFEALHRLETDLLEALHDLSSYQIAPRTRARP